MCSFCLLPLAALLHGNSGRILTLNYSLALTEMRTILARIAWNFDLQLDPASSGWLDKQKMFTTWHKTEMRVKLKPRCTPDF